MVTSLGISIQRHRCGAQLLQPFTLVLKSGSSRDGRSINRSIVLSQGGGCWSPCE